MLKSALISSLALLLLSTAACKKEAAPTGGSGAPTTATPPPEAAPATPAPTAPATGDAGSAAAAPTGDATGSAGSAATAPATPPAPAGALPAELKEFEALLSPLVAMPEGEARSKKTCEQLEQLRVKSLPVRRYAAPGVDAAAWEKASNEMRGAFEGLGGVCGDDSPDESADLKTIHQAYLQLVSLLPR
jgi:hypothetical protein